MSVSAISAILYLAVLTAAAPAPAAGQPSFSPGKGYIDKLKGADETCRDAFNAEVACGPELGDFMLSSTDGRRRLTDHDLDALCTASCLDSLLLHSKTVMNSCWDAEYQMSSMGSVFAVPPTYIPIQAVLAYHHACFKNGEGQYCNAWDQGAPRLMTDLRCDGCWSRNLHLDVTSPLGTFSAEKYRHDAFQSAYCHHEKSTPGKWKCTRGEEDCACRQLIKPGKDDTWLSLSLKHSVTTHDLSSNNGLKLKPAKNVHRWPLLCIPSPCRLHVIKEGETCGSIASAAGVSVRELMEWNPVVELGCSGISKHVGETLCVSERESSSEGSRQKKPAYGDSPFDLEIDQDVLVPEDL